MATIDSVKLPDNSTYDLTDNYSGYQKQTLATPITVDGTSETTVEGALGAVNDYADKIEGSMSNENLLDNPWFTVNQRGWTTGTIVHNAYCVDRWRMSYGSSAGTITVTSNGVKITPASGTVGYIEQVLENASALDGKPVTGSVLFSDGTIKKGTTQSFSSSLTFAFDSIADDFAFVYVASRQAITLSASVEKTIRAIKLEIGTVSTLHLDIAPNYTTELLKCQRYFVRIQASQANVPLAVGMCKDATDVLFTVDFPVPMRAFPTFSYTGSWAVTDGYTYYPITLFTMGTSLQPHFYLFARIGTSSLVAGQAVLVSSGANGDYIDFSADL